MCLYLDRGEANADSQFAGGSNDGVAVLQDLESILEERRLDRNEVLEGGQRDGLPQQLPVAAVREVTEDELVRIGHEVVGVQFILNILRAHLQPEHHFPTRKPSLEVEPTISAIFFLSCDREL